MPRPFSDRERDVVRQRLHQAGYEAFAAFGLRRTTVDDLARSAGISKGGFYLFYDSKEALLFEILERFEADFQARLLQLVLRPGISPRESLRELVRESLAVRSSNPLLRRLTPLEFEQLQRRISPQQAELLRRADVAAAARFVGYWRQRGVVLSVDSELLAGVLRALVLAGLHETEIGPDVHPRALEWLVEAVAARLVPT